MNQLLHFEELFFDRPDRIVNGTPFTVTANSGSAALSNLPGTQGSLNRSCATFVGGGAAANGHNLMMGTASLLPRLGKRIWMAFGYYSQAMAVSAFAIGHSTVTTTLSEAWKSGGTPPANSLALVKRATETDFTFRSQKASGGAQAGVIATPSAYGAMASNIWYDFLAELRMDPSTAGLGYLKLWRAASSGDLHPVTPQAVPLSNIPDSVVTAFGFQFQAGDTGTTNKDAVSHVHYAIER